MKCYKGFNQTLSIYAQTYQTVLISKYTYILNFPLCLWSGHKTTLIPWQCDTWPQAMKNFGKRCKISDIKPIKNWFKCLPLVVKRNKLSLIKRSILLELLNERKIIFLWQITHVDWIENVYCQMSLRISIWMQIDLDLMSFWKHSLIWFVYLSLEVYY